MKGMKKKLILISFALAIMAAGAVFVYLQSLKTPSESIKNISIIVAKEIIPEGTLIEKEMVKEIQAPESSINVDYIKDYSQIVGKYSKETIMKNEGFLMDKLIDKYNNENELSLKIDANYRAVSINVTGDSGVSDLIKPGDYVDIIVYLPEKTNGQKIVRPDLAKVIIEDVEILAIDKQLVRDNQGKDSVDDKIPTNFLVTASIPVSKIEKLVLAENIGSLKLALRPINNKKIIDSKVVTEKELLSEDSNIIDNGKSKIIGNSKSIANNKKYKYKYYRIISGDTLKKISRAYYGNSEDYILIKEANKIENVKNIITGSIIKIPVLTEKR